MAPVAQRARGTQDLLPADQPYWAAMERAAQGVAVRAGYRRIETPIFEATELFVRSAGEGSDVVSKEMYTFTDRGDRSLTLRPEGTAPIVRAYFDGGLDQEPQPVRLFYLGPFFRYDRPQAGRYRQFHQFGIEAIGEEHPMVDVEAIQIGWEWFIELGVDSLVLKLNSIGDEVCRPAYRDRLRGYYRPHLAELCEEDRIRFERNPLRLLDCKVPQCQPFKAGAPRIVDHLCEPCEGAFATVKAGLEAAGIEFELDPGLVRGLDYYTRTVFEYQHASLGGAQNALGGGGRYDGLATALGYRPTPGIGFALGLDRTLLLLKQRGAVAPDAIDVYAVALQASEQGYAARIAATLRGRGLRVVLDPGEAKLDGRLRKAAKRGARVALIIGPDERARGEAVVRDMQAKAQVTVPEAEIVATVTQTLARS
ncbi:MAG: histidine--tRNA ligase [Candidatus Dormibacteraeota bacterium]|nr:histidine--tRNA ligase [Candidatus Dormibacteraeota bacterium]